jgi:hypothetical protein
MLTNVKEEACAGLLNQPAILHARNAKVLIAEQNAANIYPWPAINRQSRRMYATPAMTGDIASKTDTSTQHSMRMRQPAGEDPKADRESG